MDNPKKKKLDSKRIALKQKHEVDYLKKRARELIKICDAAMNEYGVNDMTAFLLDERFPTKTIKRICKALIKSL